MITYGNTCPAIDDAGLCGLPLDDDREFCEDHEAARRRMRLDPWPASVVDAAEDHHRAIAEESRSTLGGSRLDRALHEQGQRARQVVHENTVARLAAARREST